MVIVDSSSDDKKDKRMAQIVARRVGKLLERRIHGDSSLAH